MQFIQGSTYSSSQGGDKITRFAWLGDENEGKEWRNHRNLKTDTIQPTNWLKRTSPLIDQGTQS